jgi:hypothetical protein
MITPYRICHLIGHRRERYMAGYYWDRRGRQREKWYSRCTRCGTSDGGEVYREGLLERLTWWRIRSAAYRTCERLKAWVHTDCFDCKQPEVRFGRHVGDHTDCIPF